MTNYNNSQNTVSDISTSDNKTSNTNKRDSYTSKIPLKNITHNTLLKTSLIAQKSFPLRISSVNVTKSAVSAVFHIVDNNQRTSRSILTS